MSNFTPPFLRLPDIDPDDNSVKYHIVEHAVSINSKDRYINRFPSPYHFVVNLNGHSQCDKNEANLMINPNQIVSVRANCIIFCDAKIAVHKVIFLQIDEVDNINYNTTTPKHSKVFANLYIDSNNEGFVTYIPYITNDFLLRKNMNNNKLTITLLDINGDQIELDENIDYNLLMSFGIKRYHL
jgi:hypothetical protein